MDSKSGESNPFADESNFKSSIDSCNHLISKSLRDLNKQYKDLIREQVISNDLNKKDIAERAQRKNSDKK